MAVFTSNVDINVLVAALDLPTIADEWEACDTAQRVYAGLVAKPEAPSSPEPVETGVPVVCAHKGKGGMWLECEPGVNGSRYRTPNEPKTTLTLVDDDGVIRITFDFKQLEALSVEITRVLDEHDQAEHAFQAWRTAQAEYEDARKAWNDAHEAVGKAAKKAYKDSPVAGSAVEPDDDARDDDDPDEDEGF